MTSVNGFNPMLRAAGTPGQGVNLSPSVDMNALLGTSGVQAGSSGWQATNYSQTGIQGTPYKAGSGMASFLDGLNGVMAPTSNAVSDAQGLYQKQQLRKQMQSAGLTSTSADGATGGLSTDPNAMGKLQELFGQLQAVLGGGGTTGSGGTPSVGSGDGGVSTADETSGKDMDYGSAGTDNVTTSGGGSGTTDILKDKPSVKATESNENDAGGTPDIFKDTKAIKLTHENVDQVDFKKIMSMDKDKAIETFKSMDLSGLTRSEKDRFALNFALNVDNKFSDKIGGVSRDDLNDREFSADDLHVIGDLAQTCFGNNEVPGIISYLNAHRGEASKDVGSDVSFWGGKMYRENLTSFTGELKRHDKSMKDEIK